MPDLWSQYMIDGGSVAVSLRSGGWVRGTVVASDHQWLLLDSGSGRIAIQIAHIQAVACDGAALPASLTAGKRGVSAASAAPSDSQPSADAPTVAPQLLRKAIDAMFDGADNASLQELLGISRQEVGQLRKAFACVRGDCDRDQLSAAAQRWVDPLQAVASGASG